MKPITNYKELLVSLLQQIKESEVTDERIIDLHTYIDNSLALADSTPVSFDVFLTIDEHKHLYSYKSSY